MGMGSCEKMRSMRASRLLKHLMDFATWPLALASATTWASPLDYPLGGMRMANELDEIAGPTDRKGLETGVNYLSKPFAADALACIQRNVRSRRSLLWT